ncbi:HEAT repeat domain-containing protein [Phenylobacterium sp.]|uniref:HEAT repeat domain-containing protein n=1 Tax=Phenylobacterium sp. TaxID=1871053 RepID=UPI0011FDBDF6|nr:HEAT repeat domain-containing protein [Phenylobacterium sp.]THD62573.1 MAG: HEAT repeat domain-containing protein [Phenylobacterium sp.]
MPLIRKGGDAPAPTGGDEPAGKLRSTSPDERWAAARALSGRPEALASLTAALATEQDPRVREALLTGLARIGTPQGAAAIVPLIRSDDASLRTGAIDALRVMPAAALAGPLDSLLSDPETDVRILACDLARALPAPQATRLLCGLLAREPEANVCAAAADVLAECGEPDALPALAACAERFVQVPFLVFALRVAGDRIRAQTPVQDG